MAIEHTNRLALTHLHETQDELQQCEQDYTPVREAECADCGAALTWYRGDGDISCRNCPAEYNAFGQQLRHDWRGNPAWRYDDIDDLEGYELQYAGD